MTRRPAPIAQPSTAMAGDKLFLESAKSKTLAGTDCPSDVFSPFSPSMACDLHSSHATQEAFL
jgi:hypothetical protein